MTQPPPVSHPNPRPAAFATAWAVYLGCSWTWCIGMFLPVLLVRDYGLAACFIFAIPNVVGAAAMGWVLAKPGASERLLQQHRTAAVAFSIVTLAFHAFFLFWMTWGGIIPPIWAATAVIAGSILGVLFRRRPMIDLITALATLAVSLIVLGVGLCHPTITTRWGRDLQPASTALPPLAVVCVFGFLLCPYLDVTFHRAVAATAARKVSRLAFGMGFGLFFLAMIVLTLLYEGDFNDYAGAADHLGSFGRAGLVTWVALHLAVQIGFTWSSHLRALPAPRISDLPLWIGGAVLAAVGIFFTSQKLYFDFMTVHMQTGELVYRLFMGFYGLFFPAYVWLTMVPLRGRAPGPARRAIRVWAFAAIAAAPAFWLAFVAGRMPWLFPGVGAILMARALIGHIAIIPSPGNPGEG